MSETISKAAADCFDRVLAGLGLLAVAPLFPAIAAAIAIEDGFPVFFGQTRVGRGGRPFRLWKFRSMRAGRPGTRITADGDSRVTRAGVLLRRFKLDELPQLWNVLRGDMSLVGPRPEVPAFVDPADPLWREVLTARPGITDVATLVFRNEEELLAGTRDPERYYREIILPDKLELNVRYLRTRSFRRDLELLAFTAAAAAIPHCFTSGQIRNRFLPIR